MNPADRIPVIRDTFNDHQPPHPYILGDRVLGNGGFATVFQGRTRDQPDQAVAVKVYNPHTQHNDGDVARFHEEIDRLEHVRHKYILKVRGHGNHYMRDSPTAPVHEHPFVATEQMDRGDLSHLLKKYDTLPLEDVISIAGHSMVALAHAHERGIVHRDVKPPNILLSSEPTKGVKGLVDAGQGGTTKIGDFGAAVRGHSYDTLTAVQFPIGTPAYMSPEHLLGRASKQSDQYSLAVVMGKMIAGGNFLYLPSNASVEEWADLHANQDPSPFNEVNPGLPPNKVIDAIEEIVRRALAKNPGQRYASMGDFLEEFTTAVHRGRVNEIKKPEVYDLGSTITAPPTSRTEPILTTPRPPTWPTRPMPPLATPLPPGGTWSAPPIRPPKGPETKSHVGRRAVLAGGAAAAIGALLYREPLVGLALEHLGSEEGRKERAVAEAAKTIYQALPPNSELRSRLLEQLMPFDLDFFAGEVRALSKDAPRRPLLTGLLSLAKVKHFNESYAKPLDDYVQFAADTAHEYMTGGNEDAATQIALCLKVLPGTLPKLQAHDIATEAVTDLTQAARAKNNGSADNPLERSLQALTASLGDNQPFQDLINTSSYEVALAAIRATLHSGTGYLVEPAVNMLRQKPIKTPAERPAHDAAVADAYYAMASSGWTAVVSTMYMKEISDVNFDPAQTPNAAHVCYALARENPQAVATYLSRLSDKTIERTTIAASLAGKMPDVTRKVQSSGDALHSELLFPALQPTEKEVMHNVIQKLLAEENGQYNAYHYAMALLASRPATSIPF